jgi:hypothetical protein
MGLSAKWMVVMTNERQSYFLLLGLLKLNMTQTAYSHSMPDIFDT